MATVYRGLRDEGHGVPVRVAVKVLHPHLADDPDYVRMFQEEAALGAQMDHPALVRVLDYGEADGVHYMVMDLLEGRTLGEIARQYERKGKAFPPGHALWITSQVLEGLHAAHQLRDPDGAPARVVHRDVSPSNILVTASGAVRVVDFGIARSAVSTRRTQFGVVKGTVPYMAPEQARGGTVDHRADIFAVGVLLYELLVGEVPLRPARTEDQRAALAQGEVTPALKRVHIAIRPAVARALAVEPDARYETADAMAKALLDALRSLSPDYEPARLAGLAGVRRNTRSSAKVRVSAAAREAPPLRHPRQPRPPRPATGSALEPASPTVGTRLAEVVSVFLEPPIEQRTFDATAMIGLVATLLLLIGMLVTFLPAVT